MASTVWKGYLTFGLVSVPVRLYAAARTKSVRFNQLYRHPPPEKGTYFDSPESVASPSSGGERRDNIRPISGMSSAVSSSPARGASQLSRVVQELRPTGEENTINREDLVKGYEYSPNQYVVVEKSEIQNLVPKTSPTMDLYQFVKLSEVDPIFFERSYYVTPETGGEKAYALLFHAMRRTGYCGVAKVAMHRREHVVILRPDEHGILAHTMYYLDEIRNAPELPTESILVPEKELRLAETFIKALAGPFRPESFRDDYRAGIVALIEGKVRAEEVVAPTPARAGTRAADIMEALKASLEQLQVTRQTPERVRPKPSTTPKSRKRRSA